MSLVIQRRRRPLALLAALVLPASLVLAGCGEEQQTLKGLDAVTISGSVGSAPKFDWKDGTMTAGKTAQSKVLTKGDGEALAKGDDVLVKYAIGNGYNEKTVVDTYTKPGGYAAEVGADAKPQQVTDLLLAPINKELQAGVTVGTRFAVAISSQSLIEDYLGDQGVSAYMSSNDIGNEDPLVIVADVVAKALKGPEGTPSSAARPAWAPEVTVKDDVPTGLNFAGVPKPDTKLEVSTLIQGSGKAVEDGDFVSVNYLGAVYQGKTPFDESYTKAPFGAVIDSKEPSVVKGWIQGLTGVKVGSRILLKVPPALGYGDQAQGDSIPANSTLYFVIDVLGAA